MALTPAATFLPLRDGGGGAQIFDPAIGAGADKDMIHLDVGELHVGGQAHIVQRAFGGGALMFFFILAGSGTLAVIGSACSGEVPQVTIGTMSRASSVTSASNLASGSDFRVRQ